jgi:iron complex outermembrane receptor protein
MTSGPGRREAVLICSTVGCLALMPSPAFSATAAEPSAVESTAPATLAEIVVTAQKREESISKVGLTISAIGADDLRDQRIRSVADLAAVVPGLTFTQSGNDTPVYTLRGVGFYETTLAAYPDVTVYVDQVPLPFPAMTRFPALDLDRVEVLKGPQGILFGQNSTGGAINYVAAKPTGAFASGLDLTYGRFERSSAEGFVSGPLTDTLRARFAARWDYGNQGWQESYYSPGPGHRLGKVNDFVGRLLLDWKPADAFSLELNLNGWSNKSDPLAGQYIAYNPQNDIVNGAFGGLIPVADFGPVLGPQYGVPPSTSLRQLVAPLVAYPFAPQNAQAADWFAANPPRADERNYQASLRADLRLNDDITLTSVTAYDDYQRDDVVGDAGVNLMVLTFKNQTGAIHSFNQELRLANGGSSPLRWVVGTNYERSTALEDVAYGFINTTAAVVFSNQPFFNLGDKFFANAAYYSDQSMKNYAGFANLDYDISSRVTLKAGARYTEADRSDRACTRDPGDGTQSGYFAALSGLLRALSGLPPSPVTIPPGGCFLLDKTTLLPAEFNAQLNENNVSWRAGLDFKPTDHALLYLNVAKGFKAGSFGAIAASTSRQYEPVTQESVLDYEAGFKLGLLDNTMALTGAAFYYDYKDKQLRSKLIDVTFGILDALVNVPKSSVKGAELALAWRPVAPLNISAAATYLHARVDEYVGVNAQGVAAAFAGAKVPFTPSLQLAGSADYRWALGPDLGLTLGGTVTHHSETFGSIGSDPVSRIAPYTLLDLRLSLEQSDGPWKAMLWGKNVTNKYYWTNTVAVYDTTVRYAAEPATYGATVSYRFR